MSVRNVIDHVKIAVASGKGGAGSVHFRRARFIPKGGPDGGDGGRGSHVIIQGNAQLSNLLHFKYRKHIFGENGAPGRGKNITGADGKDIILQVPLGTIAKDADTGRIKAEIIEKGQKVIVAQGGRGGRGNTCFKSATRQAPDFAQLGQEGEKLLLILELKMMADIGLLGLPNAGKSTLLSVISAAKPQIASYPFTTINPQLGTVMYAGEKCFVVADIPGIIQGASRGKGLGLRFLRHAERTKVLLFVIASDDVDIASTYYMLREELRLYNADLLRKKHLLAISKVDLCEEYTLMQMIKTLPQDLDCIAISSKTGLGIRELKTNLRHLLHNTHS